MKKLAVLRSDIDNVCPFGLSITTDCQNAGNSVFDMEMIVGNSKDNARSIINSNRKILAQNSENKQCIYAMHLFEKHPNIVDCNATDTAAGISNTTTFNGSPYYSQIGEGLGMGGLYNYPLDNQSDGFGQRNLYYGISQWAQRKNRLFLRKSFFKSLLNIKN